MKLLQEYQTFYIFLPEHHGVEICLNEKVIVLENSLNENVEENIYQEYFDYVIKTKGWFYPHNTEEAFEMFQQLTHLEQ